MKQRDLLEFFVLAALWGASFLFLRIAGPSFGPFALVQVRLAVAAAMLLAILFARRAAAGLAPLRTHALPLVVVGAVNSALPFVLLSYATLTITAGLASIVNATSPLFAAVVAVLWLHERLARLRWLGLAIGLAGVGVLVWGKVGLKPGAAGFDVTLAIGACLLATLAYGIAANYTKRYAGNVDALAVAAGSQLAATLVLLPFGIAFWPREVPPLKDWLAVVTLGVACTGFAYMLFFGLIKRVGPTRAVTVTYLIPAFGMLWGALFLDETITPQMLAGAAVILLGTALATGVVDRRFLVLLVTSAARR
jgi:drug/metabolite transporter (DMT)-like permease